MAKIAVHCPHCGGAGAVDESHRGKKLKCPKCGSAFQVPNETNEPAEAKPMSAGNGQSAQLDLLTAIPGASLCTGMIAFSSDGKGLIAGSKDNTARRWDFDDREPRETYSLQTDRPPTFTNWMSFTGDASLGLIGNRSGRLLLWNCQTGSAIRYVEGQDFFLGNSTISADGKWALSAGINQVYVIELASGVCVQRLKGHNGTVSFAGFSTDGSRVVSLGWDKTAKVWDPQSGECVATLESAIVGMPAACAWLSADGRKVLLPGPDFSIKLFDVDSLRCLLTLEGHTDRIFSLSASPSGTLAVSGSADQKVRLWSLSSGQCLQVIDSHTDRVNTALFSPEGNHVVTKTNEANSIWVWRVVN